MDDLDDLTDSQNKGNLNHKMAFIYFDGNKFSKIRVDKCDSEEKLTAFSECVEKHKRDFLCKTYSRGKSKA